jgi:hypothetical protein
LALTAPLVAPDACRVLARDYSGSVVAAFSGTLGAIRLLPEVGDNPQLAGHEDGEPATVCYVDGSIPKGPPPMEDGSIPPSFDRAVMVVVGDEAFTIALGYRERIPIQAS